MEILLNGEDIQRACLIHILRNSNYQASDIASIKLIAKRNHEGFNAIIQVESSKEPIHVDTEVTREFIEKTRAYDKVLKDTIASNDEPIQVSLDGELKSLPKASKQNVKVNKISEAISNGTMGVKTNQQPEEVKVEEQIPAQEVITSVTEPAPEVKIDKANDEVPFDVNTPTSNNPFGEDDDEFDDNGAVGVSNNSLVLPGSDDDIEPSIQDVNHVIDTGVKDTSNDDGMFDD
jgi:hypothetical protein